MLDVLMYLFEHYMDDATIKADDQETLKSRLTDAGFTSRDIHKAFGWMDALSTDNQTTRHHQVNNSSIRLYSWEEERLLDSECRGYLHFLEQCGVLSPITRELVIDRILALENDDIDLDNLKWVILMVLFNQPDQDTNTSRMEDLIFSEPATSIH